MSAHREIEALAWKCQAALATLTSNPGSMFHKFSRAACGPASELIGRALQEHLGIEGKYVCGVGHPSLSAQQSHAWFEVGGFIIDVTHHQFDGTGLEGWVFPSTSPWHAQFEDIDRRAGYCMPSGWPMYPHDGYGAITRALVPAQGQP